MIVLSDASPIIALSSVGYLEVLRMLYEKVVLPEAVCQEITVAGKDQPGTYEVWSADWIDIRSVSNRILVNALETELDPGEAEAIALAVEDTETGLLLMDERRGRSVAKRLGINVVGVMGVLAEAKHRGLIRMIKPVLDELVMKVGFAVRREVYEELLSFAGERRMRKPRQAMPVR